MARSPGERFRWAVEILDVQPDDFLLEIGCGHGIAVDLICGRLTTGRIVGIDQSAGMIDTARRKNQACSTAEFLTATLKDFDAGGNTFSKVFAINVNVFWQKPALELAAVRRLLRGRLYLFYEPPSADKISGIAAKVQANLASAGFTVIETQIAERQNAPLLCVTAEQMSP